MSEQLELLDDEPTAYTIASEAVLAARLNQLTRGKVKFVQLVFHKGTRDIAKIKLRSGAELAFPVNDLFKNETIATIALMG